MSAASGKTGSRISAGSVRNSRGESAISGRVDRSGGNMDAEVIGVGASAAIARSMVIELSPNAETVRAVRAVADGGGSLGAISGAEASEDEAFVLRERVIGRAEAVSDSPAAASVRENIDSMSAMLRLASRAACINWAAYASLSRWAAVSPFSLIFILGIFVFRIMFVSLLGTNL